VLAPKNLRTERFPSENRYAALPSRKSHTQ